MSPDEFRPAKSSLLRKTAKGGSRLAAPEEPPTPPVHALRPSPEPNTILLVISGPIGRADVLRLCERVRVLLQVSDANQVVCDVEALLDPDAVTVEALARLQLTALRLGRRVRLRHACDELQDLIALMGLAEVVSLWAGLPLEPRGQAEEREQARGVDEEADPADPTA
jgi:ABC-type transporter Mla MlaB component